MPAGPILKRCPGCLKRFTSVRAHLAQTLNPLCRRLVKKKKSSRPGPAPISPPTGLSQQQGTDPLPTPHNSPPVLANERSSPQGEGDSELPDYTLSHTPSDEGGWDDEESDDEDNDLDSTSESSRPGWEPPVSNDTENMSVDSEDDTDSGPPPPYVPPEDLRERTWVAPKVVKFPSPRAGEPVRSADSTNNAYATRLGTNSDSNPYHPFASKLDWEVAKWAKLQGPSSTSLMDLLKIEGVMPFCRDN